MGNRRHSKIGKFPKAIQDEFTRLIFAGETYESIAAHLKQMGHEVSKSAVGREAKPVLAELEKLRASKALVKTVLDEGGGSGLEMEEVASQLWAQKMIEYLMTFDKIEGEEAHKLITALAKLQQSSSQRETVKALKAKVAKAAEAVKEVGKKRQLDPETIKMIEEEILGLVR